MNDNKLMQLINTEREMTGELEKVRLEICKQLKQGETKGIYSDEIFEGAHITMTETKVLITHTEGIAYSFVRPDVKVSISVIPIEAKAKGGKSGGGGRPKSKNPSASALYQRDRRAKQNERKANEEDR